MRILYFIDALQAGGKERQLIELLKGMSQRENIEFILVVMSGRNDFSNIGDLISHTSFLIRESKKDLNIFSRFFRLCQEFKPDIIHSWNPMCSFYAIPIAKLLKIKFINGIIRDAPLKLKPLEKTWIRSRLTFPFSDIILANSAAGIKSYKAPPRKSYHIYNGFDISRIQNLEEPASIKSKFGIKTSKIVGMVAGFSDRKDYKTLIRAANQMLEYRNDLTFVTVGDGETINICKNLVEKKYKDKLKFLGLQDNVESIINVFNIGVLLTNVKIHGEGISNSIMEYMALSKPVIATECGGTAEIVINNETGFLIKPEDVGALLDKTKILLDCPELAKSMGEKGRKRIFKEFSIDRMVQRHLMLYQNCILNQKLQINYLL